MGDSGLKLKVYGLRFLGFGAKVLWRADRRRAKGNLVSCLSCKYLLGIPRKNRSCGDRVLECCGLGLESGVQGLGFRVESTILELRGLYRDALRCPLPYADMTPRKESALKARQVSQISPER